MILWSVILHILYIITFIIHYIMLYYIIVILHNYYTRFSIITLLDYSSALSLSLSQCQIHVGTAVICPMIMRLQAVDVMSSVWTVTAAVMILQTSASSRVSHGCVFPLQSSFRISLGTKNTLSNTGQVSTQSFKISATAGIIPHNLSDWQL